MKAKTRIVRKAEAVEWFFGLCLVAFVIASLCVFTNGISTLLALTGLSGWWRIITVVLLGVSLVVVCLFLQGSATLGDALGATLVAFLIIGLIANSIGSAIHYRKTK